MVDFEASELESSVAVICSSLTTYVMSMAGSYKKDMETSKKVIEKLVQENKKLKEKLQILEEPVPAPTHPSEELTQPIVQPSHPQNLPTDPPTNQ